VIRLALHKVSTTAPAEISSDSSHEANRGAHGICQIALNLYAGK